MTTNITQKTRNYLIGAIIALSGVLGWQFTELSNLGSRNCTDIRVIATITEEKVKREASPSTQRLIAKITFPGLSHAELVRLVTISLHHEEQDLKKLQKVQRESCG